LRNVTDLERVTRYGLRRGQDSGFHMDFLIHAIAIRDDAARRTRQGLAWAGSLCSDRTLKSGYPPKN
jgi:hypothetical protein